MGAGYGRTRFGAVAVVAAVVVAATGCAADAPATPASTPQPLVTVKVGVLVPLTGPGADSGRGALESVRRVIVERESEFEAVGLVVEASAADDRGQQSVGQQEATTLADDPATIGIIGSTESRVDEGVQPILARAGLVTLSLGGSEPTLTRTVRRERTAFDDYLTLSAQRLDRPAVAATLLPRRAASLVLRGPRREDAAMAEVFTTIRVRGGSPAPEVRRLPVVNADGAFDPAGAATLRTLVRADKPESVYVVADPATEWATILTLRSVLPSVPIVADEDVLGPWPDSVGGAEEQSRDQGVAWGPLWTTTSGATPSAADVPWPPVRPTPSPSPTEGAEDAEASSEAADEAIDMSRFSVAAHDAAQALLDGVLATWEGANDQERAVRATAPAQDSVTTQMMAWRSAVADQVQESRQRGLLGPYVFDVRGVASRRLVGVYRAEDQQWRQAAGREVIGPCGTGSCAVRVR